MFYWINKQDIEPFRMINYRNEDSSTVYSYNVSNTRFTIMNFKLINENNQPILDAPDFLFTMKIIILYLMLLIFSTNQRI